MGGIFSNKFTVEDIAGQAKLPTAAPALTSYLNQLREGEQINWRTSSGRYDPLSQKADSLIDRLSSGEAFGFRAQAAADLRAQKADSLIDRLSSGDAFGFRDQAEADLRAQAAADLRAQKADSLIDRLSSGDAFGFRDQAEADLRAQKADSLIDRLSSGDAFGFRDQAAADLAKEKRNKEIRDSFTGLTTMLTGTGLGALAGRSFGSNPTVGGYIGGAIGGVLGAGAGLTPYVQSKYQDRSLLSPDKVNLSMGGLGALAGGFLTPGGAFTKTVGALSGGAAAYGMSPLARGIFSDAKDHAFGSAYADAQEYMLENELAARSQGYNGNQKPDAPTNLAQYIDQNPYKSAIGAAGLGGLGYYALGGQEGISDKVQAMRDNPLATAAGLGTAGVLSKITYDAMNKESSYRRKEADWSDWLPFKGALGVSDKVQKADRDYDGGHKILNLLSGPMSMPEDSTESPLMSLPSPFSPAMSVSEKLKTKDAPASAAFMERLLGDQKDTPNMTPAKGEFDWLTPLNPFGHLFGSDEPKQDSGGTSVLDKIKGFMPVSHTADVLGDRVPKASEAEDIVAKVVAAANTANPFNLGLAVNEKARATSLSENNILAGTDNFIDNYGGYMLGAGALAGLGYGGHKLYKHLTKESSYGENVYNMNYRASEISNPRIAGFGLAKALTYGLPVAAASAALPALSALMAPAGSAQRLAQLQHAKNYGIVGLGLGGAIGTALAGAALYKKYKARAEGDRQFKSYGKWDKSNYIKTQNRYINREGKSLLELGSSLDKRLGAGILGGGMSKENAHTQRHQSKYTAEYNHNSLLHGKQKTELPDFLQKEIIDSKVKTASRMVGRARGSVTDMYDLDDPEQVKRYIAHRDKDNLGSTVGLGLLGSAYGALKALQHGRSLRTAGLYGLAGGAGGSLLGSGLTTLVDKYDNNRLGIDPDTLV